MAAVQKPTIISFDALLASYLTRTGSLSVRQLTNAPACEREFSDAIQYCSQSFETGDFKAQQKLEFDRWRSAIAIVQRMREAGISCELFDDFQNGH
jgi:hypothetical protein